jgi:hypothetical protein
MRTVEGTCGAFDNRQEFDKGYEAWMQVDLGEEE